MNYTGLSLTFLLVLGACSSGNRVLLSGGTGINTEEVCRQQSRWATTGKVDGRDISITCADGYNAR
tara:strand:+ start:684 stop:881 length:198 start_codon:yes stop_codon:yes gene_type:complete